ncbi:flavin reductase family protein [Streptomyces sp. NPDC050759]|uniref:flavin reductase family protein n=1 Tax=Streptomyces sp. NPDC050759 TaxID=3365635 RepID=UPI0037B4F9C5
MIPVPVDEESFRELFRSLPSVVAVVSTTGHQGKQLGLTCNAVTAVSLLPPLLSVCIDRRSDTLSGITVSGGFAVNFLAAGRAEISQRFASDREDKFAGLPHFLSPFARHAPVLTEGVSAVVECRVHDTVEAGDHRLVLGHVERCTIHAHRPLTYFNRQYDTWPGPQRQAPDRVGHP